MVMLDEHELVYEFMLLIELADILKGGRWRVSGNIFYKTNATKIPMAAQAKLTQSFVSQL